MSFREAKMLKSTNGTEKQVYKLLSDKQYYLAYSMAKCLEARSSVSLYVNLALCLKRIGETDQAIFYLKKAYQLNRAAPDAFNLQLSDEEIRFLRAEDEDQAYGMPVDPEMDYPMNVLDLRIELILLELYRICGNKDEIQRIIHKYQRFHLKSIENAKQYLGGTKEL